MWCLWGIRRGPCWRDGKCCRCWPGRLRWVFCRLRVCCRWLVGLFGRVRRTGGWLVREVELFRFQCLLQGWWLGSFAPSLSTSSCNILDHRGTWSYVDQTAWLAPSNHTLYWCTSLSISGRFSRSEHLLRVILNERGIDRKGTCDIAWCIFSKRCGCVREILPATGDIWVLLGDGADWAVEGDDLVLDAGDVDLLGVVIFVDGFLALTPSHLEIL